MSIEIFANRCNLWYNLSLHGYHLFISREKKAPPTNWSRLPGQMCRVPNKQLHQLAGDKKGCFVVKFSHNGRLVILPVGLMSHILYRDMWSVVLAVPWRSLIFIPTWRGQCPLKVNVNIIEKLSTTVKASWNHTLSSGSNVHMLALLISNLSYKKNYIVFCQKWQIQISPCSNPMGIGKCRPLFQYYGVWVSTVVEQPPARENQKLEIRN